MAASRIPGKVCRLLAMLALAAVLAACAAPPNDTPATGPIQASPTAADAPRQPVASAPAPKPAIAPTPPGTRQAPPMSDPLPALQVPDPKPAPGASVPTLDVSCRTTADCAVKNVGNCCGFYPRCVNVAAKVDPAAVMAQCQRTGELSVCGFKEVESCECVRGECQDQSTMLQVR